MANISKIKINGVVYDIKDVASGYVTEAVVEQKVNAQLATKSGVALKTWTSADIQ